MRTTEMTAKDKVFGLIVAKREITTAKIAQSIGIPKPSVRRIASELRRAGLVCGNDAGVWSLPAVSVGEVL